MDRYATGQSLKKSGAVSGYDMTIEAASAKLAYLLGQKNMSIEKVKELMQTDLRGEVTPPSSMDDNQLRRIIGARL